MKDHWPDLGIVVLTGWLNQSEALITVLTRSRKIRVKKNFFRDRVESVVLSKPLKKLGNFIFSVHKNPVRSVKSSKLKTGILMFRKSAKANENVRGGPRGRVQGVRTPPRP